MCVFASTIQFVRSLHNENTRRQSQRHIDCSILDHPTVISRSNVISDRLSSDNQTEKRTPQTSTYRKRTSVVSKTKFDGMQSILESFRNRGFSEQTTKIFMASWTSGTKRQYDAFILRWFNYCCERKITPLSPSLEDIMEFLTKQYKNGLGYESINTARTALSALDIKIEGFKDGSHPLVIRYMKGVFKLKPPKQRYTHIWDVNDVLCYLRKLSPVKLLSLKDLTLKLTMLMALTQAARVQTLHLLSDEVRKTKFEFVIPLTDSVKQNRPSFNVQDVTFKAYPPDRRLCVYTVFLKNT